MKKRWISYAKNQRSGPMTFWVHRPVVQKQRQSTQVYDPPKPPLIPSKGFAVYYVEFDNFVFQFISLDEMDVCIQVLGEKNLPSVEHEWQGRTGPGSHWLNKLPGHVLPWTYREPAVEYLKECRVAFAATDQH